MNIYLQNRKGLFIYNMSRLKVTDAVVQTIFLNSQLLSENKKSPTITITPVLSKKGFDRLNSELTKLVEKGVEFTETQQLRSFYLSFTNGKILDYDRSLFTSINISINSVSDDGSLSLTVQLDITNEKIIGIKLLTGWSETRSFKLGGNRILWEGVYIHLTKGGELYFANSSKSQILISVPLPAHVNGYATGLTFIDCGLRKDPEIDSDNCFRLIKNWWCLIDINKTTYEQVRHALPDNHFLQSVFSKDDRYCIDAAKLLPPKVTAKLANSREFGTRLTNYTLEYAEVLSTALNKAKMRRNYHE